MRSDKFYLRLFFWTQFISFTFRTRHWNVSSRIFDLKIIFHVPARVKIPQFTCLVASTDVYWPRMFLILLVPTILFHAKVSNLIKSNNNEHFEWIHKSSRRLGEQATNASSEAFSVFISYLFTFSKKTNCTTVCCGLQAYEQQEWTAERVAKWNESRYEVHNIAKNKKPKIKRNAAKFGKVVDLRFGFLFKIPVFCQWAKSTWS